MSRWRAEYDDGIWRFYRDGMELGLYEKGDVVIDALNNAESRIAELEAENDRLQGAWFKDETICPDGSLKPKVSTLLSRIAELEAESEQLTAHDATERQDDKWIPVSERLPEVGEAVLIAYRIGRKWYIARARMNKEGQFRFTKNTKPVTHWMPLPEPPEVK